MKHRSAAATLLLVALCGCQPHQLMPTPNIYASGEYELFEDLASELKTSSVDVLYVTDRTPIETDDGTIRYGHDRSKSVAWGRCVVEFGTDVPWETIVAESTSRKRSHKLPITVTSITELGRLPPTPSPLVERDGQLVIAPETAVREREILEGLESEVRRRLGRTPRKEIVLYVHGYKNTFEYAAGVAAELWHFMGREGVFVLYTWPAGSPGLLKGYTEDRESGEFTIFHLKEMIRALASFPDVRKIHVLAHSRGTDIASSALRELMIEERGGGRMARETFKIGTVVMASPDVDLDVITQRFVAERYFMVADRLVLYVSEKDKAIGAAEWLMRSRQRLGHVRPEDFSEDEKTTLEAASSTNRLQIIDARVKTPGMGHSYYLSSPAVSSDLILAVRYGADPGSAQRPLAQAIPGYWVIDDKNYPFVEDD